MLYPMPSPGCPARNATHKSVSFAFASCAHQSCESLFDKGLTSDKPTRNRIAKPYPASCATRHRSIPFARLRRLPPAFIWRTPSCIAGFRQVAVRRAVACPMRCSCACTGGLRRQRAALSNAGWICNSTKLCCPISPGIALVGNGCIRARPALASGWPAH